MIQEELFGYNGLIRCLTTAAIVETGILKTVLTHDQEVELNVVRDRNSEFEPEIVPKYSKSLPLLNDQIISLYSRGMTTRDIQSHLKEIYGVEVSPELISKVTDAVHEDVRSWRTRPLVFIP